jgi:hypothetical protein
MNVPNKTQQELSAIQTSLGRAIAEPNHEASREIVRRVIRRVELLAQRLAKAPVALGRKGGKKTAERGPEYFKQIAAMRKTRAGGRPRKNPSEAASPGEVAR